MTDDHADDEITRLRARVAELEAELTEQQRRTNAIVAEAQQQLYWLERWHVDINEVMARPGAESVREALRLLRVRYRQLLSWKRWVFGLKQRLVG